MTAEAIQAGTDYARTPRHDPGAERVVLGLCLAAPQLLDELHLSPDDFYRPDHAWWWTNLTALRRTGDIPISPTSVNAELSKQPVEYQRHGGGAFLAEIISEAGHDAPTSAPYLAKTLRELTRRRRLGEVGQRIAQLAAGDDLDQAFIDATDALDELTREQLFGAATQHARFEFVTGGSFILDTSPDPEPLWGRGQEILLADGESLIIAARGGLGKTTLAQQLALGRCGFREYAELLGYPIQPGARRTLYLAMDRPRQIARSFRRMVGEVSRTDLDKRLVVWQGPPPADLAKHPGYLLALCEAADADTVIIDSLKDAAIGLSEDDVGAGYNRARQKAIAAGVQLVELHHNRKELGGGNGKESKLTIDDLYGSTWLPNGAGSVIILTGAPGDPIVGMQHVKQPASEIGPLQIIHDHERGRSTVWHAADLVTMAAGSINGITAKDAAIALYTTDKPIPAQVEKARRKLDQLAKAGKLQRVVGDQRTSTPAHYLPALRVAS